MNPKRSRPSFNLRACGRDQLCHFAGEAECQFEFVSLGIRLARV